MIGAMDTADLAALAARAVNWHLAAREDAP
jgi:hypothetical protein